MSLTLLAITPLGAFAISLAINLVLTAATLLTRPRGKDRRTDGFGADTPANDDDPTQPMAMVYGRPSWVPPVIAKFFRTGDSADPFVPQAPAARVTVLSAGAGPLDGTGLKVWMNDELLSENEETLTEADKKLTAVDTERRLWEFPRRFVEGDSVVLYEDGTALGALGENAGFLDEDLPEEDVTATVALKPFTSADDPSIAAGATRYGAILPTQGIVTSGSFSAKIVMKPGESPLFVTYNSGKWFSGSGIGTTGVLTVPTEAIRLGRTKAAGFFNPSRQYVWIDFKKGGDKAKDVQIGYRVRKGARAVFIRDADGRSRVLLADAVPGQLTAVYRTARYGNDIRITFRPGDSDQPVLPIDDGYRATFPVASLLDQGVPRRYATTNEVDDLVVGLASGPEGFFEVSTSGQSAGETREVRRHVQIRIRRDDAPDEPTETGDPADGWVLVADGNIRGRTRGRATWFFPMARLLAKARNLPEGNAALPRAAYEVEVVALDAANVEATGEPDPNKNSVAYLDSATEIVRTPLVLPYHATVTVEILKPDISPSDPVFAIQCGGRKVWVPDADAVYSEETGRADPGALKWSRVPEWCGLDLVTNPLFGGGQHYSWEGVDLAAALGAASFHGDLERNHDGSFETRAELDIVIRHRSAILDHVAQCHAGAKTLPTVTGDRWRTIIDRDQGIGFAITDADIERLQIHEEYPRLDEVPTTVEAATTLERDDYELERIPFPIPGAESFAYVSRAVDMTGVRRLTQVQRAVTLVGHQLRNHQRLVTIVCKGWRCIRLEAGDLVTVTSTALGLAAAKFRVVEAGFGDNLKTVLRLLEHVPAVYSAGVAPVSIPQSNASTGAVLAQAGGTQTKAAPKIEFFKLEVTKVSKGAA